jgi:hypothetical protein
VLCLRVLQAALVHVKKILVQDIVAADERAAQLTDAGRRGLTPLLWTHVALYGEVRLHMGPAARMRLQPPMARVARYVAALAAVWSPVTAR